MTEAVAIRLAAILATVALGWIAARAGWLGRSGQGRDTSAAEVLGQAAFYLFVPALLFRTMVRLDLATLPWHLLAAYFVPAVVVTLLVYGWRRRRGSTQAADAATGTVAAVYGNGVQLGIPMAAALFGERGLALHIALVSMHGLILLSLLTVLVESDLARAHGGRTRWQTLRSTLRNTVIHPVMLPVLLGLAFQLSGLDLHPVLDLTLQGLGSAVVPLCLVLIGVSLATYGVQGRLLAAVQLSLLKLLVLPAAVLLVALLGFGLQGLPLAVLVMMAALPVGSNALIFAQRYGVMQAESSSAIVISTVAFAATSTLWLAVLGAAGLLGH
jgi:malonate transporter